MVLLAAGYCFVSEIDCVNVCPWKIRVIVPDREFPSPESSMVSPESVVSDKRTEPALPVAVPLTPLDPEFPPLSTNRIVPSTFPAVVVEMASVVS